MNPYDNIQDFMMMTGINQHSVGYSVPTYPTPHTLDICSTPCPPATKSPWKQKCQKEDQTPMASYASATVVTGENIEAGQRDAVRSALRSTRERLSADLKKSFGLTDDDKPSTPAEFVKRITDGLYTIDKDDADRMTYSPECYLRWRDPAKVEDKAGFKAAYDQLLVAYEDVKLKAILSPVADLLQLVEDFKAFKA